MTSIHQHIKGYEIREKIGEGGFGIIYRAFQPIVEREVAIKSILPEFANEPEFIRDFETEARLIARLEHPHIVPIFDYWRDPNGAYLVMRWLRGGSLSTFLKNGRVSSEIVLRWLDQITGGLAVAHRNGVIHCDIKPANILLDEDSNVYLTDFGLAALPEAGQNDDRVSGSVPYLAPEQLRAQTPTPQSDIYSLGIVLYEMLTGNHPFGDIKQLLISEIISKHLNEQTPALVNLDLSLPEDVNVVIQKATAKAPEDRYATVQELARDFRRYITGQLDVIALDGDDELINPYKGLHSFEEVDAHLFFGRDLLVKQLLDRLQETDEFARFLSIVGASGSGKSSVVFAGLVPALKQGKIAGSEKWFVVEFVPSDHPMQQLEAALLSVAASPPSNLMELLGSDTKGLLRATDMLLSDMGDETELVIIIDQFEEIFTLLDDEAERVHFLQLLYEAVTGENSRIRVIVTLRADFYHKPLNYEGFGTLIQQRTQVVLPLTTEELEQAITAPAKRVGYNVDPDLVATVITDVREEPGGLPLLQYALTEVFERREGRRLTLSAYQNSGGAAGSLGRRAEEVFSDLNLQQQSMARQIFQRLVSLGEGTEDTRRRVHRSELAAVIPDSAALQTILDAFGKYRLLTFDQEMGTREPMVELAHEAIIREWKRLGEWLNTSRDQIRQQRILGNLSSEWLKSGKDNSYLLRGTRLQISQDWLGEGLSLTETEQDFLETSIHWKAHQETQEMARVEYERSLEEKAYNRLRLAVGGLLIGILMAIGLSIFAFRQQSAAEDAREVSETNAQIAEQNLFETWRTEALFRADISRGQLESGAPETALLIALEAAKNYPQVFVPEMHTAVHTALYYPLQESANFQHLGEVRGEAGEGKLGARWNHDETLLLTWSVDGNARIWKDDDAPEMIFPHDGQVNGAIFSPDEHHILTWSVDGTARIWDAATGTELHRFDLGDSVFGAVWDSREERVLAWTLNGIVQVWDVETEEMLMSFRHQGLVRGASWNKDETAVLSWSDDKSAVLWNETGVLEQYLHTGTVFGAVWNEAGDRFLSWSAAGAVYVWNLETPNKSFVMHHDGLVVGASWSADETRILSWSEDATVRVWDATNGDRLAALPHDGILKGAIFNHDLTKILSWTEEGSVYIWSGENYSEVLPFEVEPNVVAIIEGAAWSADETRILTWSKVGNIRIYDSSNADAPLLEIRVSPETPVWEAKWIHAETQVMTLSSDGSVRLWTTQYEPMEHVLRHDDFVRGAIWNRDNTKVLTWSTDTTARVWDLTDPTNTIVLDHDTAVLGATWNAEDTRVLTWTADGGVFDWDLSTAEANAYTHNNGSVVGARWNQAENLVLSWAQDNTARVWGDGVSLVLQHDAPVFGAVWNADESAILTWSEDGMAKVWDAQTGELRLSLLHDGSVGGAAWIDQEHKILTWTKRGIISVWDAQTGEELRSMHHDDVIKGVALTRDQARLLSWSNDRTIRIWNVSDGSLISNLDYATPISGAVWNAKENLVLAWEEGSGTWGRGRAFIWNPQNNAIQTEFTHELRPIRGARWSPDETEVLTWSWDNTVKIWDVIGEREPITLYFDETRISFEEGIWGASWSADGNRILSLPSDGTARIFIVDMDELIRVAKDHVVRPFYDYERALAFLPPETITEVEEVEEDAAPIPTAIPLLLESTIVPTPLPQPTATPQLASQQAQTIEQAMVYAGDSRDYPTVTTLPAQTPLEVLAIDDTWFYVQAEGVYGWVDSGLVVYSGDLASLPSLDEIGVHACDLPDAEFQSTWAKVHWQLGCPVSDVTSILSTAQPYVNGIMTWRSDTRNIFVILNDGRWAQYADTWRPGEQLTCSSYYTALGFGKVYCNNPEVQALLGAPTGPERIATLRVQNFEYGSILESLDIGRLYLLDERELIYEP